MSSYSYHSLASMPAAPNFGAITLLAFVDTRLSTIGSYSEANALTMGGFYTRASMMTSTD
jgi:hypothetical protein